MDDKNERIYNSMLSKVDRANKTLGNSVLCVNIEVPLPPRPTNRDRLLLWRKRNIAKPVIEQSDAILFLEKKGYKLNNDYEAYQAIDLAKEIKTTEGIVEVSNNTDLDNAYTESDNNIFRRMSFMHMNKRIETHCAIPTEAHGNTIKPSAPPMSRSIIYPPLECNEGEA
jgi:hypothetical protein